MKLVQKTKELQLINDYYKKCLLKYISDGFTQSSNMSVNKIIHSLTFTYVKLHREGLIEAEVSFLIGKTRHYKKLILNDFIEYNTYNYLTDNPTYMQIMIKRSNKSLIEELKDMNVIDKEREIEEWLAEINLITVIRQILSN